MSENILQRKSNESIDGYLLRLGAMKDSGLVNMTWTDVANIMNEESAGILPVMSESRWRKHYRQLRYEIK